MSNIKSFFDLTENSPEITITYSIEKTLNRKRPWAVFKSITFNERIHIMHDSYHETGDSVKDIVEYFKTKKDAQAFINSIR